MSKVPVRPRGSRAWSNVVGMDEDFRRIVPEEHFRGAHVVGVGVGKDKRLQGREIKPQLREPRL